MARLKETQKRLDKKKWLESEKQGYDMSGCMTYCKDCEYADHSHSTLNGKCYATQQEKENNYICARQYEKITKRKALT